MKMPWTKQAERIEATLLDVTQSIVSNQQLQLSFNELVNMRLKLLTDQFGDAEWIGTSRKEFDDLIASVKLRMMK